MTAPDGTTESSRRSSPRSWLRSAFAGCATGLVVAVLLEMVHVTAGGNFHAVLPGRVYRTAQPSPEHLEYLIQAYGIRTVINLRGCCNPFPWYLDECRVSQRNDVAQEDICFSAGRLPSAPEVRRLVEALDRCEYPIVFHCQRGADRTGLASAVALLLQNGVGYAEARRQLGLRYGHLALGRPSNLDWFFSLYTVWLREQGLTHSPAAFRRWIAAGYCAGPCRCRLEWLEPAPVLARHRPVAVHLRAHNTSRQIWHLQPDSEAGIHLAFHVYDDHYRHKGSGRAGLFAADVPPGGSIDLTLVLPSLERPGKYYLLADMVDEQQCFFYQTGSEPLVQELEVREQETAPGVQRGPPGPAGLANELAAGR